MASHNSFPSFASSFSSLLLNLQPKKTNPKGITLTARKMSASQIISKRRKFVADGVFQAELNDFFTRELAEEGYAGCEVRVTHARTEIIIRATHTQEVLGDKGRRIRELKALIEKRFKFPENALELYAEKVQYRGLSATAQAESLRYKLLGGLAMRRWVFSTVVQSFWIVR